jgi:hypothetical protein
LREYVRNFRYLKSTNIYSPNVSFATLHILPALFFSEHKSNIHKPVTRSQNFIHHVKLFFKNCES